MSRTAWAAIGATAAGLAVAAFTLDKVGFWKTIGVLAGLSPGGLLAFLAAYGLVLIALGLAWSASNPAGKGRALRFAWARAVREAANDLLPFSQIGGLLFGLKVLIDARVPPVKAYAATVIDLTTELISQMLLVLAGVTIAIEIVTVATLTPALRAAIWAGAGVLILLCVTMLLLRKPVLALAGKMADRALPAAGAMIGEIRAELAVFESSRFALLPAFLWNAIAWLLSIGCVWLGLVILGHPLSFDRVLALEALISVVRSGAFLVPGALGVQEAGYALLGPLFGLDPGVAIALSLLKRGRDVTIGVPILLTWQAGLLRRRTQPA